IKNDMRNLSYLNGYYWLINLGDLQLDKILTKGVAETHIHISVGVNFNIMWQDLMGINLENSKIDTKPLISIFNNPHLDIAIQTASIVRLLLFRYLLQPNKEGIEHYLDTLEFDTQNDIKDTQLFRDLIYILKWHLHPNEVPVKEINFKKLYNFLLKDIQLSSE